MFSVGELVRVISLKRTGEIVECARGGRYRVRVAGVVLSCREDDLEQATAGERRHTRSGGGRAPRPEPPRVENAWHSAAPDAVASIDLHGLTVEEALCAVEQRIDLALREGAGCLDVVHGKGTGRIKSAVHKLLKEISAVRRFEVRRENPGVTRVHF